MNFISNIHWDPTTQQPTYLLSQGLTQDGRPGPAQDILLLKTKNEKVPPQLNKIKSPQTNH